MIYRFDDLIRSHKDIRACEILMHYYQEYCNAIVALLEKLGYGEEDEYKFDNEKKKRMRLSYHSNDILGISYSKVKEKESHDDLFGFEYMLYVWYNTHDEDWPENIFVIPKTALPKLEWWPDIYNYLRIEANCPRNRSK